MRSMGLGGYLWEVLVIVAVVILLLVGIFFIVIDEPTDDFVEDGLNPEEVVVNYADYIGENITVKGYFYDPDFGDEFAYLSAQPIEEPIEQGEFVEEELLLVNYSSIGSIDEIDDKYLIQGTIEEVNYSEYPVDLICLQIHQIEKI